MRLRARFKALLSRWMLVHEFCHECGRRQRLVWTANDRLWAQHADGQHPLCPECFDRLAMMCGVYLRWEPKVECECFDAHENLYLNESNCGCCNAGHMPA